MIYLIQMGSWLDRVFRMSMFTFCPGGMEISEKTMMSTRSCSHTTSRHQAGGKRKR